MTFFGWLRARTRRTDGVASFHVTERPSRTVAAVPDVWLALHTYLDRRHASMVVLTFGQIESLLGRALPASAGTELAWWTGDHSSSDRHSDAWMKAHRSAVPNLLARTVAFERL